MSEDFAQKLFGTPPAPSAAPAPTPAAPAAADVLYSSQAPAPAPVPARVPAPVAPEPAAPSVQSRAEDVNTQPATNDARAIVDAPTITLDDLAKSIPDAIAEARKADTGRTLYGDQERDAIAETIPMDGMEGATPETIAAARTELANMAIDAGASADDVAALRAALVDARINPLTDEQRMESRGRCVAAFNEAFGMDAARTLDITRKWLNGDARRAATFGQVGDNPVVALMAARLALAAQRRR
jgi:hypothetical protein